MAPPNDKCSLQAQQCNTDEEDDSVDY